MTLIVTVFRQGGDFQAHHVQDLHAQFAGYPSLCLSDTKIAGVSVVPLRSRWPGWFAKMELFNPAQTDDDILYFDLDTWITGDLSPYLADDTFRMLSDFYHPAKPASGMMFIPHRQKAPVWSMWSADPGRWMRKYRGDQDVLERICGRHVPRFGHGIKSYKVHIASEGMPGYLQGRSQGNGLLPAGTEVVCFHGYPRPWEIDRKQIMRAGA